MTDSQFGERLSRLRPLAGPGGDAVAFAAGELAAGRRWRRRFWPAVVGLTLLAAGGWGAASLNWSASPAAPPVAPPLEVQPAALPDYWRRRAETIERLSAGGFDALGPPRPPGFPMRFQNPDSGERS